MSLNKLSFRVSKTETFVLKSNKLKKDLKIKKVKLLIRFDRDYDDDIPLYLECNGVNMDDNKTLEYYGITSNNNLITLKIGVTKSKQYNDDNKCNNNNNSNVIMMTNDDKIAIIKLNKQIKNHETMLNNASDNNIESIKQNNIDEIKQKYNELLSILNDKRDELIRNIETLCTEISNKSHKKNELIKKELKQLKYVQDNCVNKFRKIDIRGLIDDDSKNDNDITSLVNNAINKLESNALNSNNDFSVNIRYDANTFKNTLNKIFGIDSTFIDDRISLLKWKHEWNSGTVKISNDSMVASASGDDRHRSISINMNSTIKTGIHCFRWKLIHLNWSLIGISSPMKHNPDSYHSTDVCALTIGYNSKWKYANKKSISHQYGALFKPNNTPCFVDMLLDLNKCELTYKSENKEPYTINGIKMDNNGVVPHLNMYYKGSKAQIAKIPVKWFGKYFDTNKIDWKF